MSLLAEEGVSRDRSTGSVDDAIVALEELAALKHSVNRVSMWLFTNDGGTGDGPPQNGNGYHGAGGRGKGDGLGKGKGKGGGGGRSGGRGKGASVITPSEA